MNYLVAGLILTLEAIFVVGAIGSSLVLILTLVEDAKTLFQKERSPQT